MIRPMSTLALALGAFALLSCNDTSDPTQPGPVPDRPLTPEFAWASNSWQTRAPMPTGRAHHAVGVAKNASGQSILYVFGGVDTESNDLSTIEAYDYSSNSWTTKTARFQGARTNGVGQIGEKLYIAGGLINAGDGPEIHKRLVIYDPALDVTAGGADLPRPIADGITGVIGGKLYVLSGICGECPTAITSKRFYRYDPATNTWSYLPWSPRSHRWGAGGVINGKLYVAGGINEDGSLSSSLDVYDPVTNKWTARGPLPERVYLAAGAVLNNKLYVIGGNGAPDRSSKTVYVYDPAANTWTTKAPLITDRYALAAATLTTFGNTKILALGGIKNWGDGSTAPQKNEAYKP
jgi:N-acetylneuraminic acid mutarotase